MMEKWFHLKENHTDMKTEILAGITTFMTMAYILAVNPDTFPFREWTKALYLRRLLLPHVLPRA